MGENELVYIASKLLGMLLSYGCDCSLAEYNIRKMLCAYGHEEADVIVMPDRFSITIYGIRPVTEIHKAGASEINLSKMYRCCSLIAFICRERPVYNEIIKKTEMIEAVRPYSFYMHMICAAVVSLSVCFLAQGSITEIIMSAAGGVIAFLCIRFLPKYMGSELAGYLFCGILTALFSILVSKTGITSAFDKMIFSSLLVAVPNNLFLNSIHEFSDNKLRCGIASLVSAVTKLFFLLSGAAVILYIFI